MSDMIARVYGEVVVVRGLAEVESEVPQKQPISLKMRFLNILKLEADGWKIVVSERTPVSTYISLWQSEMFSFRINDDTELRLLEAHHADMLFALTEQNRDYLKRWLPWLGNIRTVEDTLAFIRSSLGQLANNNGFQAGIWHDGRLAGVIGYHRIDWDNKATSIGYWIGEDYQGRGIITQACRVLVEHAFAEWKLNRVEISCAVENKRSRAIPERLGFRLEGELHEAEWLYDRYVNHVLYAVLAKEWQMGMES